MHRALVLAGLNAALCAHALSTPPRPPLRAPPAALAVGGSRREAIGGGLAATFALATGGGGLLGAPAVARAAMDAGRGAVIMAPTPGAPGAGIRGADANGPTYGLPKLPYAYDAFEPWIDAKAMEYHRDKHHAIYVDTLNKALAGKTPVSLARLQGGGLGGAAQRDALKANDIVRNSAGGHYNHCLFFASLCPAEESTGPSAVLRRAFDDSFGGEDGFEKEFKAAAASVFGSGWAWAGVNRNNRLVVTTTANQDNPLMDGSSIPFLGLDCCWWTTANQDNPLPDGSSIPLMDGASIPFKYENKRADYIDAFFNVINWRRVSANYAQFASQGQAVPCTQGDLLAAPPPQGGEMFRF